MARASAAGSSGGTSSASWEDTPSGLPPTAVATIGVPVAIASSRAIDVPSARELSTKRSNAENSRPASGRFPNQRNRSATPRRTASASSCGRAGRSEEHTSELQSRLHLVCRLLLEKKKKKNPNQDKLVVRDYRLGEASHV